MNTLLCFLYFSINLFRFIIGDHLNDLSVFNFKSCNVSSVAFYLHETWANWLQRVPLRGFWCFSDIDAIHFTNRVNLYDTRSSEFDVREDVSTTCLLYRVTIRLCKEHILGSFSIMNISMRSLSANGKYFNQFWSW